MMSVDSGSEVEITMRDVTRATVRTICNLHVAKSQEQFVAPNSVSIAEAYFSPWAWFRAIYADETPVGFVMMAKDLPKEGQCLLWRFMIDERYQKRGYGRKALQLVIQHVREKVGAQELVLSYHAGSGSPQPFYEKLGFQDTGEKFGDELVMSLKL